MAGLSAEGRARQAALIRRYRASLPEKSTHLKALWQTAQSSGWEAGDMDALSVQVHRLAGSAGSYGLDSLGAAAARLEACLKRAGETPGDGERIARTAQKLLQELLEELDLAACVEPDP